MNILRISCHGFVHSPCMDGPSGHYAKLEKSADKDKYCMILHRWNIKKSCIYRKRL